MSTKCNTILFDEFSDILNIESAKDFSNTLVKEILKEYLENYFNESQSSYCESKHDAPSDDLVDRRLKRWQTTLQQRQLLQKKIQKLTGKRSEDVLFNRSSTLDEPKKAMIKRILERVAQLQTTPDRPSTYIGRNECDRIFAQPQRKPEEFEVVGMPEYVQREMLGTEQTNVDKYKWFGSEVLNASIDRQADQIKTLLEYFPDVEKLEIHGLAKRRTDGTELNLEKDIELLENASFQLISTDSITSPKKHSVGQLLPSVASSSSSRSSSSVNSQHSFDRSRIEIGLLINDKEFIAQYKTHADLGDVKVVFEGEPFLRYSKEILNLKNIGKQTLAFHWLHMPYYDTIVGLHMDSDHEFIFSKAPFVLNPRETRKIQLMYQPRRVGIVKEKWILQVKPRVFCSKRNYIVVMVQGSCLMPTLTQNIIDKNINRVIELSNWNAAQKLVAMHGSLAPIVKSQEVHCPYVRAYDERQIFNAVNFGYNCQRFEDLETLKSLYKRLKKPIEPSWDLSVESIKSRIMRLDNVLERKEHMQELLCILETMKGAVPEENTDGQGERDLSRFIYVRGVVRNGIEEWSELASQLEAQFLKATLAEFLRNQYATEAEAEEYRKISKDPNATYLFEEQEIAQQALKDVHSSKYFRDSMYMQTYTVVCDIVENIVSVIESTQYV